MDNLNFEKLKEHKQHGESMLPIALYTVIHYKAGPILPYHWHNELEFIYLSDGEAVFTLDNEVLTVQSGECIFVNGGQIHSGFSKTADCTYLSVVFDTELLTHSFDACREYFDGIKRGKFKICTHFKSEVPSQNQIIIELKAIIEELTTKTIGYEFALKSKLFFIFSTLFRENLYTLASESHKSPLQAKKYYTLRKIMGYIYQNYDKKIKLTDISESVNFTPQYLCKFFKEMTDTSIACYINHYRIEAASTLLKISTLSITDIALECGFDNLSYFNRVFKKQMGCTPTIFRSKHTSYK
ncbi:AraC family transcriptional regulator [Cellulosilyticum sp. I15G10I2]|uniref:AraC family transcriptional regulator n=1 Tax=Cellulosilyticum sp. I15G10I2 TaxID=1892843 RepID=UPI00085BD548|nr:AraC family transcriptional regulator [Cellulosilyticum sp. I15G10I2]